MSKQSKKSKKSKQSAPPKVKKSQLGKKAAIEKLVQQHAMITVKLPTRPAIQHPLKQNVCLLSGPLPTQVPRPQTIAVRLPPCGPLRPPLNFRLLKFLDFPGEIRNRIYDLVFTPEMYELRWADNTKKSLSYRFPMRPAAGPRLAPYIIRRRRLFDYPRRIRSNEVIGPYHLSPGPAALLLTCKKVNEEASPLFYGNSTFAFKSLSVLTHFLSTLSITNKAAIRSLHLKHHTAGNPFLTLHTLWKAVYDEKWEDLCFQISEELKGLEELSLILTINDVPILFDINEPWMYPLLYFEDIGLRRCSVILQNHSALDTVLEVEAYKLRMMMLGDAFEDGPKCESQWFRQLRRVSRGGANVLTIREW